MKVEPTLLAIVMVAGFCPVLSGCKPGGPVGGAGTGFSWVTGVAENLVPGIDSGNIQHEKVGDTDIVVVWTDRNALSSTSTSGGSGFGTRHSGKHYFLANTGGPPDLEWQSDDNGAGSVTCGQTKYDLKAGRLILVSTTDGKMVVKQLMRDVSKLKLTREGIQEYVAGDNELREFFTRLAPPHAKPESGSNTGDETGPTPKSADSKDKE